MPIIWAPSALLTIELAKLLFTAILSFFKRAILTNQEFNPISLLIVYLYYSILL